MNQLDLRELPDGISIKIKVQPRASRNAVSGVSGDCLKLQLTSPPVDGAANEACINFFAEKFKLAKGKISIVTGVKSRTKIVKISDISKTHFLQVIPVNTQEEFD